MEVTAAPTDSRDTSPLMSEKSSGGGSELDFVEDMEISDVRINIPPSPPNVQLNMHNIDDNLPDTVTLLTTELGAKVYLVGTAHFSKESQDDVVKIINAVQPNIVMVELCASRLNILQLDEETILEEAKNINMEKILTTVKQNGMMNGMMYILLLNMSAHITKQLGMAPGGEFRTAFKEAKKVPNCIIHLGDRPISITLQRALGALSWWQTLKLGWHLLTSRDPISKEDVERCKRRDLLEELISEMAGEYPALGEVFVNERDTYLTHSLQTISSCHRNADGSLLVPRVVGVVGIGHTPGIAKLWKIPQRDNVANIMIIPPKSLTSRIIRTSIQLSLLGLVVYSGYKCVPAVLRLKTNIVKLVTR